jgi:hypothetical protein
MDAAAFFNRLATAVKDHPPYPADDSRLWMLRQLSVQPGQDFDITLRNDISKLQPREPRDINIKL